MRGFRIFILGAGFSHAAGLPLGEELWNLARTRASDRTGRAGRFDKDMESYLQYRLECDGLALRPEEIDFEDFLGFLDLEHYLELAGSDTWSHDGNESQVLLKSLIGQAVVERTPDEGSLPQIYYDFAEQLQPGDYVLTFNYDTVLEKSLSHVGRDYRMFPSRFTGIKNEIGAVDSSADEVVVIKLHGSVDWFDRTGYSALHESYERSGFSEAPDHPVFGPAALPRVEPLLEGPQFADDPLASVYRVREGLADLYSTPQLFRATPWLLTPSRAKVVYAHRFKYFWWGLGKAGGLNLGIVIVGYSLPPHDDYAKQTLFRILRNYQDSWWDLDWAGGLRKSAVLLIDRQEDATSSTLLSRYGFIDREKATYHFSGFDDAAMQLIEKAASHPDT